MFVSAATGGDVTHISKQSKAASDTSTDPIEAYPVRKSDVFIADIDDGTMADSFVDSGVYAYLDSSDPSKLDLTSSPPDGSGDVNIVGWDRKNTAKCYIQFKNTVS